MESCVDVLPAYKTEIPFLKKRSFLHQKSDFETMTFLRAEKQHEAHE